MTIQYLSGYRAGLVLLCVVTFLYVIGFSGAHWYSFESGQAVTVERTERSDRWRLCVVDSCLRVRSDDSLFMSLMKSNRTTQEVAVSHGLWLFCLASGCYTIDEGVSNLAQALECVSLASLLLAVALVVLVSFFAHTCLQSRTRLPEIVAAFGSLTGLIGALIFMGSKYNARVHAVKSEPLRASLGWSFTLVVISTVVGLVSAGVLAFHNYFLPARRPYTIITPDSVVRLDNKGRPSEVYTISRS